MTRLSVRLVGIALACTMMVLPTASYGQDAPAPAPAEPAPAPAEPAPMPAEPAPAPAAPTEPAPAAPSEPAPAQPAEPAPAPAAPAEPAPAAPAEPAPAPAPAPEAPAPAAPAEAPPAAPAEPAAPQPPQGDQEIINAVENFWHYGKVGRYDLAQAEAQKILAKKDTPVPILLAFEKAANERTDVLDDWLFRWQGTEQLKDVTSQIMTVLNEGRRTRRSDPAAIEANVKRLINPGRGYMQAMRSLRDSGELAVPILIDYLRDPAKAEFHDAVRNALRDLGRPALNPLVAVVETKNQNLLLPVVTTLGELGYGAALPYLMRVATAPDLTNEARVAASQAMVRMGSPDPRQLNPSELFYELAEKFYYDNADIAADKRDLSAPANIWYWDEAKGLTRVQVPQQIFNEIMAMRACEYALKLGQSSGDSLSLWLASNYKREAELPEGAIDGTRAPDQPSAHFYGVDSGAQYLNNALARALRDRNSQVALRVIKSLQEIIGRQNLFGGNPGGAAPALIDAMASSDRSVRFEAAFAVASAAPQQQFQGQDRVVPLLAEALSQSGVPSVLVVMGDFNRANALVQEFRQAGYGAVGGIGAEAAVTASNQLPAIDVILIAEDMGAVQVDQMLALAQQNAKLAGAAKVIMVRSGASPYTARAINNPLLSTTLATDAANLKTAVDNARGKASAVPIDQTTASSYALRAAELLQKLAMIGTSVFDLSAAEQTVLNALNDPRPDVVKAAGNVLGHLNSQAGQAALLQTVLNEKTGDDVRISLLKSLASSAKVYGNRLAAPQVQSLEKLIESATNQEVKNGAGEARGALNLPADQAKTLIVKQSRV
jgi:outer membrane biosynthesis protein TonB